MDRDHRGYGPVLLVAVLVLSAASSVAAGHGLAAAAPGRSHVTFARPATALASGSPGDLLSKEPIELAPELHGTGWRITYVSTTPGGDRVPVSGVVIQPLTPAPAGGYPVVVWTHGTTGLGDQCAPSDSTPFDITGAAPLLDAGDVVVAPDYEGLGIPGDVHPYLVGAVEGHNALDAARAARAVGAGNVVVTWGWSQGGHAALFARQLQPRYAPELDFRGAAAQAPVTDVGTFLLSGASGTGVFPLAAELIVSWSAVYRELDVTDLAVAPDPQKARLAVQACTPAFVDGTARPFDEISRSALQRSSTWQAALRINSVRVGGTTAPVLLTHGDADTAVPVGGTLALFARLCARDVPTQFIRQPTGDHFTAWASTMDDVTGWIADRIAGARPPSDCP